MSEQDDDDRAVDDVAAGFDYGDDTERTESSRLAPEAKRALAKLLTSRYVTRSRHRSTWDAILANEDDIRERLADMFLDLEIDPDYEVVFKRQQLVEDAPKLLRRDKPLSRDASLLLIYLRKEHAYTDAHDDPVVVTRAQISEFFRAFREAGDGDEARFERRVESAIRTAGDLNLLAQNADADYLFTVAPAIVPLIGTDELVRFEQYFVEASGAISEAAGDAVPADSAELVDPLDALSEGEEWA